MFLSIFRGLCFFHVFSLHQLMFQCDFPQSLWFEEPLAHWFTKNFAVDFSVKTILSKAANSTMLRTCMIDFRIPDQTVRSKNSREPYTERTLLPTWQTRRAASLPTTWSWLPKPIEKLSSITLNPTIVYSKSPMNGKRLIKHYRAWKRVFLKYFPYTYKQLRVSGVVIVLG